MHLKKPAVIFLATALAACGNAQTAELDRTDAEKYLGIRKVYKRVVRDEHNIKHLPFKVPDRSYVDFAAHEVGDKNALCMAIYYFNVLEDDYRASRQSPPYQAYIPVLRVLVPDIVALFGEFGYDLDHIERWKAEAVEPAVEYEKLSDVLDDVKDERIGGFMWGTLRGFCLANGWLEKFKQWDEELEEVRKTVSIGKN